jgi:hypothetical protein
MFELTDDGVPNGDMVIQTAIFSSRFLDDCEGKVNTFFQVGEEFVVLIVDVQQQVHVSCEGNGVNLLLRVRAKVCTDDGTGDDADYDTDDSLSSAFAPGRGGTLKIGLLGKQAGEVGERVVDLLQLVADANAGVIGIRGVLFFDIG